MKHSSSSVCCILFLTALSCYFVPSSTGCPSTPCEDLTACCTKFGYCGYGEDYCGRTNCVAGPCYGSSPSCSESTACPASSPCCSMVGLCGNSSAYCGAPCIGGKCLDTPAPPCTATNSCADPNQCCSMFGFCGTTDDFCGLNCIGGNCTNKPQCSAQNTTCAVAGECCNMFGFCGTDLRYCKDSCIGGNCLGPPSEQCVNGTKCANESLCCSTHGFCGDNWDFCGEGNCRGGNCWKTTITCTDSVDCIANDNGTAQCCNVYLSCGNSYEYCGPECIHGPCTGEPAPSCAYGYCSNSSQCCSLQYYCGTDEFFCNGENCRAGPCGNISLSVGKCDANYHCNDSSSDSDGNDTAQCCSIFDYCGQGNLYCGPYCIGGACYYAPVNPLSVVYGACINSTCPDSSLCCSIYGWCGSGEAYCGANCRGGPCFNTSGANVNVTFPNSTASAPLSITFTPFLPFVAQNASSNSTGNSNSNSTQPSPPTPTPTPSPSVLADFAFSVVVTNITEYDPHNNVVATFVVTANAFEVATSVVTLPSGNQIAYYNLTTAFNVSTFINITIATYQNATSLTFAGEQVNIADRGVKYSLRIDSWHFRNTSNFLVIFMEVASTNPSAETVSSNSNSSSNNALEWLQLSIGSAAIYSNYIDSAIVDDAPHPMKFNYFNISGRTEVRAAVPFFARYVEIDPSYSVVLGSGAKNSNTAGGSQTLLIIIISVTVAVVTVAVIAGSVMLYSRRKYERELNAQLSRIRNATGAIKLKELG